MLYKDCCNGSQCESLLIRAPSVCYDHVTCLYPGNDLSSCSLHQSYQTWILPKLPYPWRAGCTLPTPVPPNHTHICQQPVPAGTTLSRSWPVQSHAALCQAPGPVSSFRSPAAPTSNLGCATQLRFTAVQDSNPASIS